MNSRDVTECQRVALECQALIYYAAWRWMVENSNPLTPEADACIRAWLMR